MWSENFHILLELLSENTRKYLSGLGIVKDFLKKT